MHMNGRTRVVLYGISSLMDMVAGTLLFVVPVRATHLGASYSLAGGMGVAWGLGAAVMTFFMGRIVTSRNAGRLCVAACLCQALLHILFIAFTSSAVSMLPLMFAIGLTHTMFYVPYQVFFKTVDSGNTMNLAASVGVYTFAWSLGMAFGPLWSGFLMGTGFAGLAGWQACFLFTITACVAVAGGIRHVEGRSNAPAASHDETENTLPDFARLSWVAALCGTFAFSLVRGIFPAGAVRIGMPESAQGGVIFAMGMLQALSAIFLIRVGHWMYRPKVLAIVGGMGVAGMILFLAAFLRGSYDMTVGILFCSGAVLFGAYSGSYYFYTAFHCLVHPHRAGFNIAVCEGMMAIASVIGLLIGGGLADFFGVYSPYLLAAAFIGAFTVVQMWRHSVRQRGICFFPMEGQGRKKAG